MTRQILVVGVMLGAVACGSPASPTSPSPLAASAPAAAGTALINGTVSGGASTSLFNSTSTAAGMAVTVDGTAIRSTVDALGRFALADVPAGNVTLAFSAAGVNARLALGAVAAGQTLTVDVVVSGATATARPPVTDRPAPVWVELEGTIEDLRGNARAFHFMVQGRLVKGDSTTGFSGGSTPSFEGMANGNRVWVKGTQQDGFIQAERIHLGDEPKRPEPEPMWELRGAVSRLDGTCPAISFVLGGEVVVHATRSTEFKGLECRAIANGDYVKVIGTRQPDGSLAARAIGK